jgi:hypothetical protein
MTAARRRLRSVGDALTVLGSVAFGALVVVVWYAGSSAAGLTLLGFMFYLGQSMLRRRRPSGRTGISRSDPGPRQPGYRGRQPLQG